MARQQDVAWEELGSSQKSLLYGSRIGARTDRPDVSPALRSRAGHRAYCYEFVAFRSQRAFCQERTTCYRYQRVEKRMSACFLTATDSAHPRPCANYSAISSTWGMTREDCQRMATSTHSSGTFSHQSAFLCDEYRQLQPCRSGIMSSAETFTSEISGFGATRFTHQRDPCPRLTDVSESLAHAQSNLSKATTPSCSHPGKLSPAKRRAPKHPRRPRRGRWS